MALWKRVADAVCAAVAIGRASVVNPGKTELSPSLKRRCRDEISTSELDARHAIATTSIDIPMSRLVRRVLRDPKTFGRLLNPDEVPARG